MQVDKLGLSVYLVSIGKLPHSVDSSMPLVELGRRDKAIYLLIRWKSDQVELDVTPHFNLSSNSGNIHIMLVRDGDQLGVWVNGQGNWFPGSVWCLPRRANILFCNHEPTGSGFSWEANSGLWIGGNEASSSAKISSMKLYNYAIPYESWQDERTWSADSRANLAAHSDDKVQLNPKKIKEKAVH